MHYPSFPAKLLALACCIVMLAATSCQKERANIIPDSKEHMRLSRIDEVIYGYRYAHYFDYDDNGYLEKYTRVDVTEEPDTVEVYVYERNADNLIATEKIYRLFSGNTIGRYHYRGKQLVKVNYTDEDGSHPRSLHYVWKDGNITEVYTTDAGGQRFTQYAMEYDGRGNVISMKDDPAINPTNRVHRYENMEYDNRGNFTGTIKGLDNIAVILHPSPQIFSANNCRKHTYNIKNYDTTGSTYTISYNAAGLPEMRVCNQANIAETYTYINFLKQKYSDKN